MPHHFSVMDDQNRRHGCRTPRTILTDLTSTLTAQFAKVIERLEKSPLLSLEKSVGPQSSGIYALYFNGKLVYVGKASKALTKSKRTLRGRLNEHVSKISGRQKISLKEIRCRYLTLASEWWVHAAEFVLIVHYEPEWIGSGFGSKMEGRGRPGTERVSRWNERFPKKP
jgi:hypothetical protein